MSVIDSYDYEGISRQITTFNEAQSKITTGIAVTAANVSAVQSFATTFRITSKVLSAIGAVIGITNSIMRMLFPQPDKLDLIYGLVAEINDKLSALRQDMADHFNYLEAMIEYRSVVQPVKTSCDQIEAITNLVSQYYSAVTKDDAVDVELYRNKLKGFAENNACAIAMQTIATNCCRSVFDSGLFGALYNSSNGDIVRMTAVGGWILRYMHAAYVAEGLLNFIALRDQNPELEESVLCQKAADAASAEHDEQYRDICDAVQSSIDLCRTNFAANMIQQLQTRTFDTMSGLALAEDRKADIDRLLQAIAPYSLFWIVVAILYDDCTEDPRTSENYHNIHGDENSCKIWLGQRFKNDSANVVVHWFHKGLPAISVPLSGETLPPGILVSVPIFKTLPPVNSFSVEMAAAMYSLSRKMTKDGFVTTLNGGHDGPLGGCPSIPHGSIIVSGRPWATARSIADDLRSSDAVFVRTWNWVARSDAHVRVGCSEGWSGSPGPVSDFELSSTLLTQLNENDSDLPCWNIVVAWP